MKLTIVSALAVGAVLAQDQPGDTGTATGRCHIYYCSDGEYGSCDYKTTHGDCFTPCGDSASNPCISTANGNICPNNNSKCFCGQCYKISIKYKSGKTLSTYIKTIDTNASDTRYEMSQQAWNKICPFVCNGFDECVDSEAACGSYGVMAPSPFEEYNGPASCQVSSNAITWEAVECGGSGPGPAPAPGPSPPQPSPPKPSPPQPSPPQPQPYPPSPPQPYPPQPQPYPPQPQPYPPQPQPYPPQPQPYPPQPQPYPPQPQPYPPQPQPYPPQPQPYPPQPQPYPPQPQPYPPQPQPYPPQPQPYPPQPQPYPPQPQPSSSCKETADVCSCMAVMSTKNCKDLCKQYHVQPFCIGKDLTQCVMSYNPLC